MKKVYQQPNQSKIERFSRQGRKAWRGKHWGGKSCVDAETDEAQAPWTCKNIAIAKQTLENNQQKLHVTINFK